MGISLTIADGNMNTIYSVQIVLSLTAVWLLLLSRKRQEAYIKFIGLGALVACGVAVVKLYDEEAYLNHIASAGYLVKLYILFAIYYHASGKHYAGVFIPLYIAFAAAASLQWLRLPVCLLPDGFTDGLYVFLAAFLSLVYFFILSVKSKLVQVHRMPVFWFNAGVFFHHTEVLWLMATAQSTSYSQRFTAFRLFDGFSELVSHITTLVCVVLFLKQEHFHKRIIKR